MIWNIPEKAARGFKVTVFPDPDLLPYCCEYNCDSYVSRFGGEKVEGVYVLQHNILQLYQLVRHFIVFDGNDYIDVTPFEDCRVFNWFLPLKIGSYNTFVQSLESINTEVKQETENMFYVYCYIDPTTDLPFYVGKGKQTRALVHIKHAKKERASKNTTRFLNKLESLLKQDVEPKIVYLAQNIENESDAYNIEECFIKQYGRKGYDDNGILLNVCEGSRPPSHRGRTYQQIYGDRSEEQRKKRHDLQIQAGGWFKGRRHSDETKKKHSVKFSGKNNPRFGVKVAGTTTAKKISAALKGKKHYNRSDIKLLYIEGINIFIHSNDLETFCGLNGYSFGTFRSQLHKNWPTSHKGKNKGLLIRLATETEITSYVIGGVKKDVSTDSLKNLSL